MSTSTEAVDRARARYAIDTTDHTLVVLHDDGLYRHLRWSKGGASMHRLDLITSPGVLVVNADHGTYVFSREADMLAWLRGSFSPDYWAGKVTATDRHSGLVVFDEHAALACARSHIEGEFEHEGWTGDASDKVVSRLAAELDEVEEIESEHHRVLHDFTYVDPDGYPHRLEDTYDWTLTGLSSHYLYCCIGMADVLARYDALRAPVAAS